MKIGTAGIVLFLAFAPMEFRAAGDELFSAVRAYCGWVKRGPLGTDEVVLQDANGDEHIFTFETFHNGYQALTLGLYKLMKPTVLSA